MKMRKVEIVEKEQRVPKVWNISICSYTAIEKIRKAPHDLMKFG